MKSPRNRTSILTAALCLLILTVAARAQETKEEIITRRSPVRLNVLVTDSSNRTVTDLRNEDFRVLEDGKPQSIIYFSSDESPISYGILVDSSGSMRTLMNEIIEAGRNLVGSNKPADEAFVLRFVDADNIEVLQGLTSDKYALGEALDSIYVEGGLTAVYDAINRSVDYLSKNKRSSTDAPRRLALILISDGEDRGSRARNQDALLNRLREEEIQFFIIGLTKLSGMQSSREKAANFLTGVAEATGGRAYFPKSPSEISGIVVEITRDLRAQYVIGYLPTNAARDGTFRKVQVTVAETPERKKLNVITRPGYTAPRP
ncbi:MAG TPA: VWA domain-containing protein [Pyrinomonadaceae bacterium]